MALDHARAGARHLHVVDLDAARGTPDNRAAVEAILLQPGIELQVAGGVRSLVTVSSEGRVHLTTDGREIARRLTVRHHLIERMLHEIFGMEWTKVHEDAERLEHAVSADFEARLAKKLGRGGICPHGNLMTPESPASRRRRGLVLLAQAEPGKSYVVRSVYERDARLLEFLDGRGIKPGEHIKVIGRNYDQTLTLTTRRGEIPLGNAAAEKVWVSAERARVN